MCSPNALGVITEFVKHLTKYLFKTTAYDCSLTQLQMNASDRPTCTSILRINKLDELEENASPQRTWHLNGRTSSSRWNSKFPTVLINLPIFFLQLLHTLLVNDIKHTWNNHFNRLLNSFPCLKKKSCKKLFKDIFY